MKLDAYDLFVYDLPYSRDVRWFNSTEQHGEFVALRLYSDGAIGIAEAPVKPTWSGLSRRALVAVVADLYLTTLDDVDLANIEAVHAAIAKFPGYSLAKTLVLNACVTLAASAAEEPIWRHLGGKPKVEVSWCVTRQHPEEMAREAESVVAAHGFQTLKIKGGQGFAVDKAALRAIRRAVGADIVLTVDANAAYSLDVAHDYLKLLRDEGVVVAEDPCGFSPDAAFAALDAAAEPTLLVDMPCTSLETAAAFLDANASAISVKPGRVGIPEARAMAQRAAEYGAAVCSGMYAESALGTLISLAFSASLSNPILPAEQTFFMLMREQLLATPLVVEGGHIDLNLHAVSDDAIDWSRATSVA